MREVPPRHHPGGALGKTHTDGLDVLRTKIAVCGDCARFEHVLDTIEKDGYRLRVDCSEEHTAFRWLQMPELAALLTLHHLTWKVCTMVRPLPMPTKEVCPT